MKHSCWHTLAKSFHLRYWKHQCDNDVICAHEQLELNDLHKGRFKLHFQPS